jgi:hypothetical protein
MRAAEARDTVCGARLEGSTRPERPENRERDIDALGRDRGLQVFWGELIITERFVVNYGDLISELRKSLSEVH